MTGVNPQIRSALVSAGALIAVALILALVKRMDWLGDDTARRAAGLFGGALLIVTGNFLPKQLGPLASKCGASCEQSLQRFSGWSLVLAGMVYCAAWLFAPVEIARPVSMAACAASVVLIAGRILWALRKARG